MNIEEKIKAIQKYCESRSGIRCNDDPVCPIKNAGCTCGIDVEQDYKILVEHGLINDEDIINHPNHYTNGGMECIDEMLLIFGKETVAHFCLCNAWKYRYRALSKNGQEDIDKSHWYINKYKELVEIMRGVNHEEY